MHKNWQIKKKSVLNKRYSTLSSQGLMRYSIRETHIPRNNSLFLSSKKRNDSFLASSSLCLIYFCLFLLLNKLSLQFLKNRQGRAFFIHFFIPILKQLCYRTPLLTDSLIIEIKHRHDFVTSNHEHLIRLLSLFYGYIPK